MPIKKHKLSADMDRALAIIRQHGCIVRYAGGFWSHPGNQAMQQYIDSNLNGSFDFGQYVGVGTLWALERRGYVVPSEYKEARVTRIKFPIKYILKPQQNESQDVQQSEGQPAQPNP